MFSSQLYVCSLRDVKDRRVFSECRSRESGNSEPFLRSALLVFKCFDNITARDDADQPVFLVDNREGFVARFHHHFQDSC